VTVLALPTAADARYHEFDCIWRHGPQYTTTMGPKTKKSTTYELTGFGATCAFARKWTGVLAKKPYRGPSRPHRFTSRNKLSGGPAGWDCWSDFIDPQFHPKTAYYGTCQNRRNRNRTFDWAPHAGVDDVFEPS